MQTLSITAMILSVIANGAMTFLTVFAFVRMGRLSDEISDMKYAVSKVLAITLANSVRDSFNEVNKMKDQMAGMIEDERFEEAEEMKKVIDKAERAAFQALQHFKDDFGDDSVDVYITKRRR